MSIVQILLLILTCGEVIFLIYYLIDFYHFKKTSLYQQEKNQYSPLIFGLSSIVINFCDTLGVGSYALATTFYRNFKLVPDKILPGTLNTSFALPIMVQALLFLSKIEVELTTLIPMILAAIIGGIIGAKKVSHFNENKVRSYMSKALLCIAVLMIINQFNIIPTSGTAMGLYGWKLAIGIIGNFILGMLMSLGIGLYAPCLALVYLLGLNPLVAFPIMMGSSAFLMIPAGIYFIKEGSYHRTCTLWSALGGIIGVLLAVHFIKNVSLYYLTWIVILVLIYTAIQMFLATKKQN